MSGFFEPFIAANGDAPDASRWASIKAKGSILAGSIYNIQDNKFKWHLARSSGRVDVMLHTLPVAYVVNRAYSCIADVSAWPTGSFVNWLSILLFNAADHAPDAGGIPTKNAVGIYIIKNGSTLSVARFQMNSAGVYSEVSIGAITSDPRTWVIKITSASQVLIYNNSSLIATYDHGADLGADQSYGFISSSNRVDEQFADTTVDNVFVTMHAYVSKAAGNPILSVGAAGELDDEGVRDASFLRSGPTYNIVYTGYRATSQPPDQAWVAVMLATASSPDGPYTKQGVILPTTGTGLSVAPNPEGTSDPFLMFSGGLWHAWVSAVPADAAANGTRAIGYLTATGTYDAVPTSGWTWANTMILKGKTTGWTSTGAGAIAGIAAPKVYPKDGGGYIMYICNWGATAPSYQVGYATADNISGPWTLFDTPLFGVAGGYQAEQIVYYTDAGYHYLICNRLRLYGAITTDLYNDLWRASSQTGPYDLVAMDWLDRAEGAAWETGCHGVVGIIRGEGVLHGIYDAATATGAPMQRNIGYFSTPLKLTSFPAIHRRQRMRRVA